MTIATAAAVALTSGFAFLPVAAATSAPAVTQVTGHGVATKRDIVRLLAGSEKYAVYSRQRSLATSLTPPYGSGPSQPTLFVRSRSGKTLSFGTMSHRLQNQKWETSGNQLVAWQFGGLPHPQKIDVWNIAKRTHRFVQVGQSVLTVAATPAGFVYAHGHSLIQWSSKSGTFQSLGTPFPEQAIGGIAADDRELVVTGVTSGAKVMAYARPRSYRALDAAKGHEAYCYAVNHAGAACTGAGLGFLPLDGGAATYVTTHGVEFEGAALAGNEVLYATELTDESPALLYGFSANDPTPVQRSEGIQAGPLGAYGKVLVVPASSSPGGPSEVFAATSPVDLTKLFAIPRSADTAAGFAITPNRVAYISDLDNPADPAQLLGVQSVALRVGKNAVTTGARTQIAGRDGDLQVATFAGFPRDIAATSTTTVFARTDTCCGWHPYVTTPSGTVELPGTLDPNGDFLEVAGHRVLAANTLSPDGPVEIYDTDTGKIQDLSSLLTQNPVSFALTTTDLVYGTVAGVVRQLDLDTGVTTTIYTPPASTKVHFSYVYAANGWVAWHLTTTHAAINGMRHVESHGPAKSLPQQVFGISDAGVLLKDNRTDTRTWFRPFGGAMRTLLSPREFQELPELAGHTLAWVAGGGDLKVTRYRY
ncbi:MAG TPA: hypothetical protein VHV76_16530 [Mycobacteriales bacterium]|nr:hypothetical protein [Mycobacteriales bacterium]